MGGGRGGHKRGRTQRRDFRRNRDNVWKKSRPEPPPGDSNPSWEPFTAQNAAFDEYYKEQGIVPEEEWDEFIRVLRKPLPTAFRINSSGQFYVDIREQLENDFMKSLQAEFENDSEAEPIRPLLWYPDNLAWHVNYSRMQLRKNQTLERFHEFLKLENEVGNITRQEAVSMVPPLFLDVDPDHVVLDMCAAPGSKTFQLLEIIHQSMKSGTLPNGLVIANDVDVQRCNLLIHQTKRMSTANLIVTNHEAQHFPGCLLKDIKCREFFSAENICGPSVEEKESCELAKEEFSKRQLLFDRVLCDVPCSGDGTLRKAPDIWRKWNAGMGNGLHRLQVQIAMRGLALLKVGGRMVYSTCSMNPIENEAVVSEVLRRSGDSVELIDVSAELPHLTRRPGLKKWKVRDKGVWLASIRQLPLHRKFGIVPSMFPAAQISDTKDSPSGMREEALPNHTGSQEHEGNNVSKDDSENIMSDGMAMDEYMEESCFPLERCMRIVPHDQNTGAFFIAVFHKVGSLPEISENITSRKKYLASRKCKSPEITDMPTEEISKDRADDLPEAFPDIINNLPSEASVEANAVENFPLVEEGAKLGNASCDAVENGIQDGQPEKHKCQSQGKWRGVDPVIFFDDDATISSIRNFYGISDSFPFDGHLVTRNSDLHHVKRIYYVSESVSDILRLNFQVGQQLKITSLGLKIFERQTLKEGSSGSSACAFRISSEGLPLLLPHMSRQIMSASFADFEHLLRYRSIKFTDFVCPAFREKVPDLMMGCCVIVLIEGNQIMSNAIEVNDLPIAVGCWKGRTNISVMLSEIDCRELLERLLIRKGDLKNSLFNGEEVNLEIGNEAELIQESKSSLLDGTEMELKAGNEAELTEINVAEQAAMD